MDDDARAVWQHLTSAALVGSAKQPFRMPAGRGALGALLEGVGAARSSPEESLLCAAGVVPAYLRAGAQPANDDPPLPEPCPEDDLPPCSGRAGGHLEQLWNGPYAEALPEWLEAAARAGRRVPSALLVNLLEYGRRHRLLQGAIVAVLGARGRWLAAQNPDWSYAAGSMDPSGDWQTGSRDWRLGELRRVRAEDPARGRALVASTWDQEAPGDRAAFLATLAVGLGADDEPFLEAALDDRRAEVRRAAAGLLARLPGSRLARRMQVGVEPLVRLAGAPGRPMVEVSLPEEYSSEMSRDGISRTVPGMGERAAWLFQMIAAAPLDWWCESSGSSPPEWLEAARTSEWEGLLRNAWCEAATRQANQVWLEAILEDQQARGFPDPKQAFSVFSSLPGRARDRIMTQVLWASPRPLPEHSVWLFQVERPWSAELAHAVIERLRREIVACDDPTAVSVESVLRLAAVRIPTSLEEEAAEKLHVPNEPQGHARAHAHAHALAEALGFLRFRREMIRELQS